ncbi:hypothetical protein [Gluconacetobacter asukensis]|uniref:Scaffolding protein n=1 Tax=Gluconacetobacter asukensis TaxID=1017181 RepID=A0A7W4J1E7_9PROT|nr:hypothetical protein [Gluconacetobacter asukensis]MBB2172867.1 hypothetical protein [Gluconacetobacter asukensis]
MSETLEQIDADDTFLTTDRGQQDGQSSSQEPGENEGAATQETTKPKPTPSDETPAWLRKRIDRAVAQQRDAERAAQAIRDENEQLRRALAHARGEEDQQPAPKTPAQIEAEVRVRVENESRASSEIAAFRATGDALANAINGEAGAGQAQAATQRLVDAVGLDFQNADHRQIVNDISKLPNSAHVYVALSRNPDAASEIFGASAREQYALLRDFARELTPASPVAQPVQKPAPVSQAPRPAGKTPAGQRSSTRTEYDDDVSMDEFVAMRNKKR